MAAETQESSERDEKFGERLASARAAKGFSMATVAERLGVSKATVGHWEGGKRAIKHDDLAALCTLLGVSADEMLFGVRRWPFEGIDFGLVAGLEQSDRDRLAGALMLAAAQFGLDVKPTHPKETPGVISNVRSRHSKQVAAGTKPESEHDSRRTNR